MHSKDKENKENSKSSSRSSSNSSNNNNKDRYGARDRDIYNREVRLRYWLERAKEYEEIYQFARYLLREEKASLWVIRCITILLSTREFLGKPFAETSREDIEHYIEYCNSKDYSPSTHKKIRQVLKYFFKVCYGNNGHYPEQVARLSKDKRRRSEEFNSLLTEEEVKRIIDCADTLQRKAMIGVAYETGARPEELLSLRLRDIAFDQYGSTLILREKTGERRVRMIAYAPLLREWLSIHPFRNDKTAYLWLAEATNHKHKPLGLRGAEIMFARVMKRAGIDKDSRLYVLRHSRATHLASKLTEAEMCKFFGWTLGTKVVKRYIHLAGIDIDKKLLQMQGLTIDKEREGLKVKRCIRCQELLSPNHDYCLKCGLTREVESLLLTGNKEDKEKVERLESEVAKLTALVEELLRRRSL